MRIPWPTDGGPILFQHGFEYLQARRDDQLLELGLRINEDIDQRQVPWRRGYRLATARDCARLLLHGGSLLGGLHLGFVTGRIARPVKSRRFKFQQLLGHPLTTDRTGKSTTTKSEILSNVRRAGRLSARRAGGGGYSRRRLLLRGFSPGADPETPAVCATRRDRDSAWHLNG